MAMSRVDEMDEDKRDREDYTDYKDEDNVDEVELKVLVPDDDDNDEYEDDDDDEEDSKIQKEDSKAKNFMGTNYKKSSAARPKEEKYKLRAAKLNPIEEDASEDDEAKPSCSKDPDPAEAEPSSSKDPDPTEAEEPVNTNPLLQGMSERGKAARRKKDKNNTKAENLNVSKEDSSAQVEEDDSEEYFLCHESIDKDE